MSNTNIQSALSQKIPETFPPEPVKTCAVSYWGSQRVYPALVETEVLGAFCDSPLSILACDAKGCSDRAVFIRACFHPCKLGKVWIYRRKKGRDSDILKWPHLAILNGPTWQQTRYSSLRKREEGRAWKGKPKWNFLNKSDGSMNLEMEV